MTVPTTLTTNELTELPDFPAVEEDDTVIRHDSTAFIHHDTGEFTRVGIVGGDDGPHVAGVVRYTTTRPRITPADDVISVGDVTRIQHGYGRETRVLSHSTTS